MIEEIVFEMLRVFVFAAGMLGALLKFEILLACLFVVAGCVGAYKRSLLLASSILAVGSGIIVTIMLRA